MENVKGVAELRKKSRGPWPFLFSDINRDALSNVAVRRRPTFALQKGAKKFEDRAKGQKDFIRNQP